MAKWCTGGSSATLVDLSSGLAKKIAADVSEKSDTLVARVETREERIAKLKKALDGKKLPVVSVKISERHYGPHIIDPAAETELSLILQQCGFTLADSNSTNKPAIEISGEAFSAYGMQKGNLISCKSRIEIKARDVATGKHSGGGPSNQRWRGHCGADRRQDRVGKRRGYAGGTDVA